MTDPPFDVAKAHRWFAIELNNLSWDLLEQSERSAEENERMTHAAHAALYHWTQVGTEVNHLRALCLLANVYSAQGAGAAALPYATKCVEMTQAHADKVNDFDWATGYECLARAYAAAGQADKAREFKQKARAAGDKLADAEDKKVFDGLFAGGEWHGID